MTDSTYLAENRFAFWIDRHSGRSNGEFRNVFKSNDADKAIAKYKKLKSALRQGTLRLWDGREIVLATSAPRLRTRW